jgi:hypothetical protein
MRSCLLTVICFGLIGIIYWANNKQPSFITALGGRFGSERVADHRAEIETTKEDNKIASGDIELTNAVNGLTVNSENPQAFDVSLENVNKTSLDFEFISTIRCGDQLDAMLSHKLKMALRDKSFSAVVRNHIANVLNAQDILDITLAQYYLDMANDKSEDFVWREWAIQHAATAIAWSNNLDKVIASMSSLALADGGALAGTSLLHLDRLARDGIVNFDKELEGQVVRQYKNKEASLSTRITCIGLIGRRQMISELNCLREIIIKGNDPIALRRASVASLGMIGESQDLEFLSKYALLAQDELVINAINQAHLGLEQNRQDDF